MRRAWALYPAGVVVAAVLVYAAGLMLAERADRGSVVAGVLLGAAFQLLLFAVTAVALPGKRLAAYGVGLLGRFMLVVVCALALVPATGLAAAPFLFALVSVLFATTLLEPVVLSAGTGKEGR